MRRFFLGFEQAATMLAFALFAVAVVSMGGCTTTGASDDPVEAAQNAAVSICKFLPTAETVADILKAGDPKLATAKAVAQAICNTITSNGAPAGVVTLFKAPPTVDGVVIRGKRVE